MSDLHAEPMQPARLRLRSTFLAVLLLAELLPSCQAQGIEPERSMDDALLLALASHEQLDAGGPKVSTGGQGYRMALASVAGAPRPNPHRELARWYTDMAMQLDEDSGPMYDYVVDKLEDHNRLADDLDRVRQRHASRGRGLQRFLRGVARAPVQVLRAVGTGARETFRFAKTLIVVAADQVPQLARDYIQRKIREVGGLLQGRIDLAWDRIAERVGWPFAAWLRAKVDKAFVRQRDRLLGRSRAAQGQRQLPADTAELMARLESFEKAGAMVASCTYHDLADPARPGSNMDAIPFEIRMDLSSETLAYRIEVEDSYEDYQKCEVSVVVEGAGVFIDSDEAWLQGEESMKSITSCYILNTETGERITAGPRESGWTSQTAGFMDANLTTLYWCPAAQLGGINTMMKTGRAGLVASGACQACPIADPR